MTEILTVQSFEEMVDTVGEEIVEMLDRSYEEAVNIVTGALSKCTNNFEEEVLTERLNEAVTQWRVLNGVLD